MKLGISLLRWFRKRALSDENGGWRDVFGARSDGVAERALLEANREWVFIAVDKIASSVASVRFKVMRYTRSGDDQEVFNGPLVDFLEKPGPGFTGKDFIYLNTVYKELTGNAFWERTKSRSSDIKPLIPTRVTPVVANGELIGVKYMDGTSERVIDLKNLLHDRYIDPAKPYWGKGKLARIARWVDTSSFVTEFLSKFFVNGATFGGFIMTDEDSQERIKLIKAGILNDHTGVEKAHKIGVLPKGTKFEKVASNMAEMEMGATDDRYRDKILAGFGVPKTLVGLTTEVNRASAEASEYIYAKYTIKPAVDDLIEFLNETVAPMLDSSGKYYFACDEFVPINQEIALKEREIALNRHPYKTVNEVRAENGLPPVKGGDVVYGNPLLAPLGQPAAAPEADPAPDDEEDDPVPKKGVPGRVRRAATSVRTPVESITKALVKALNSKSDALNLAREAIDALAHKTFVARVDAHQKLIAAKVRDFNNRQEREVQLNLRSIVKDVSKADLFNMDSEIAILADFVTPLLKGLMLEQAIAEYEAQGFANAIDPNEPRFAKVVARAAKRLARSYNNTTANLLKSALNDGINAGDDFSKLAERIRAVYEFSDQVRSLAVAKTEAFFIANEGSKEAYRQSGVVQSIRWYTAEDERVCEFCGPQDGRIIGVTESFFPLDHVLEGRDGGKIKLDYRAIDVPPLHTNCRCFIRPERIDIG